MPYPRDVRKNVKQTHTHTYTRCPSKELEWIHCAKVMACNTANYWVLVYERRDQQRFSASNSYERERWQAVQTRSRSTAESYATLYIYVCVYLWLLRFCLVAARWLLWSHFIMPCILAFNTFTAYCFYKDLNFTSSTYHICRFFCIITSVLHLLLLQP